MSGTPDPTHDAEWFCTSCDTIVPGGAEHACPPGTGPTPDHEAARIWAWKVLSLGPTDSSQANLARSQRALADENRKLKAERADEYKRLAAMTEIVDVANESASLAFATAARLQEAADLLLDGLDFSLDQDAACALQEKARALLAPPPTTETPE